VRGIPIRERPLQSEPFSIGTNGVPEPAWYILAAPSANVDIKGFPGEMAGIERSRFSSHNELDLLSVGAPRTGDNGRYSSRSERRDEVDGQEPRLRFQARQILVSRVK